MDQVCPSCGAVNPPGARFCMSCGTALAAGAPTTERRIVSIVFVDLVGFTERSDRADPEDVRRTLVPYHAAVKACLERFGGTLDKFIGDAVLAVFGAPVAHEDDPVRAVDAALAIRDEVIPRLRDADPLAAVRVAVNTGPALVSPGAGPQIGEAVAGDVVNTASRLHALAGPDEIVIGETTARAIADDFELEELPAATVKGKAEPVRVWRVDARCEGTASLAPDLASFVGRERELDDLLRLFEEVRSAGAPRTAVVLGEPGIGKSRLLRELHARLGPHVWLAGRCQPYGEDVAMRPVAAIVEEVVGVTHGTPGFATTLDRWVDSAPLIGAEREGTRAQLDRLFGEGRAVGSLDDLAAAVAAVLRQAGGREPLVVLVEDLHWAEPILLRLATAVRTQLDDRAVLFLGTARQAVRGAGDPPELLVRLGPLPAEDTRRLVDGLVRRFGVGERIPEGVEERIGGNPLYALEFVRAVADRDDGPRVDVPESLQAVIGARLDAVPPPLRAAVTDAAVIGPEFWVPAVAVLGGGDEERAAAAVAELARRGVLERGAPTWFASEPTYRFAHALFREVAYGRLPREQRAEKHLRAATWLESASGDRAVDRADAIAHHFVQAFDLAVASGRSEIASVARPQAASWLNRQASRIRAIDPHGAYERFCRAEEIALAATHDHVESAMQAASLGARLGHRENADVLRSLDDALAEAIALEDPVLEARVRIRRSNQLAYMGATAEAAPELDRAIALLDPRTPGPTLAEAFAFRAEEAMMAGDTERTLDYAERAIETARVVDAATFTIMALHLRGNARCERQDPGGLDDLREALRMSEELGDAASVVFSNNYLGEWLWLLEGPSAALPIFASSIDLSHRRGLHRQLVWAFASSLAVRFDAGAWDELAGGVAFLRDVDPEMIDPTVLVGADVWWSKCMVAEGRPDLAADPATVAVASREIEEMHVLAPGLSAAALVSAARGDRPAAHQLLRELETVTAAVESPTYREEVVADATRTALDVGDPDLAARFAEGEGTTLRSRATYATAKAALAEARGEPSTAERWAGAAEAWVAFGGPYEEALAWEGLARTGDVAAAARASDARGRIRPTR